MEYRFQSMQELSTFITTFSAILTASFGLFFGSMIMQRLEKFFAGSLVLIGSSFAALIMLSNVNTYAESFDIKAVITLRYGAYAGIGICLLIFILSGVYWRKK